MQHTDDFTPSDSMTSSGSTSPSESMASSHTITTAKFPSSFLSPVQYKATHGATL